MKTLIIMGSSRSDGNTRKVIDFIRQQGQFDFVDLNNYQIVFYNYDGNYPESDAFLELMEKVIAYEQIIFATPIYWYAMSAQLKTFFDRLTDCLQLRKELGYALKGKKMFMLSCGSDEVLPEGFEIPFKDSAEYLHMEYGGSVQAWISDGENIPAAVQQALTDFCKKHDFQGEKVRK